MTKKKTNTETINVKVQNVECLPSNVKRCYKCNAIATKENVYDMTPFAGGATTEVSVSMCDDHYNPDLKFSYGQFRESRPYQETNE